MLDAVREVATVILCLIAVISLNAGMRNLITAALAWRDLARAIAKASPDHKARLRDLLDGGDTGAAVAIISEHLPELPPRERAHATDALTQRSEVGRRNYAGGIALAAGLRPRPRVRYGEEPVGWVSAALPITARRNENPHRPAACHGEMRKKAVLF